jgi:hypothetical protein
MATFEDLIESIPLGFCHVTSLDVAKAYLQNAVEDPSGSFTMRGARSGHCSRIKWSNSLETIGLLLEFNFT